MNMESKISSEAVFKCLEKMLGLVLAEEDVEDCHGVVRDAAVAEFMLKFEILDLASEA